MTRTEQKEKCQISNFVMPKHFYVLIVDLTVRICTFTFHVNIMHILPAFTFRRKFPSVMSYTSIAVM